MSMRKYDNFCKALKNLKECQKYQEPYSTVTETGLVALFEICFEQAWKTMKACLQEHGYEEGRTGSPKRGNRSANYPQNQIGVSGTV